MNPISPPVRLVPLRLRAFVFHYVGAVGALLALAVVPVTIGQTIPAARLSNLSVRTKLAAGNALIAGFILSGTEPARVLVRGVGPALIPFGVADAMLNPTLTLSGLDNRGASTAVANDDWETSTGPQQADFVKVLPFSMAGAFPLPAGSRDAALLAELKPGPTTLRISGSSSTEAGTVLAEVYDTRAASEVGTTRLVNVSALGLAGPTSPMLAGFVIEGTESLRLLLRVSGPALAAFGVPGAATAARLDLMDKTGAIIVTNENWTSGTTLVEVALRQAAISVGAFPLVAGSRDAAVVVSLVPGAYTLRASGAAGVNGSVLLEIYELPQLQITVTVPNG
jgi:hypothetical protein